VCFLVSRWGNSGSISIPSASYSQDVEFYPLLHIGKEGLGTKAVSQLLNCSFEVMVITDDQLQLTQFHTVPVCLFFNWSKDESLWSWKAKGPRDVMGRRQRERSRG
jgi:hypothetical protein